MADGDIRHILDQEHFIQTEGWPVAQSLKLIRRNLYMVLVEREKLLVPISQQCRCVGSRP